MIDLRLDLALRRAWRTLLRFRGMPPLRADAPADAAVAFCPRRIFISPF